MKLDSIAYLLTILPVSEILRNSMHKDLGCRRNHMNLKPSNTPFTILRAERVNVLYSEVVYRMQRRLRFRRGYR